MALSKSTYRRIAGHDTNGGSLERDQCCMGTNSRGRMRGFHTGVTSPNNDDVKMFHVKLSLLANAKAQEDFVQKAFDIYATDERIQSPNRTTKFLSGKFIMVRPQLQNRVCVPK